MDLTIKVPAEALDGTQSFAIDFGGSMLKVVYIKKNEVHPKGHKIVHMTSFANTDLQKAIDFIKKECDITPLENGNPREYAFTGVNVHNYKKLLAEQLNVKVTTAWELECFRVAFTSLTKALPEEELYYPALCVKEESVEQLAETGSDTTKTEEGKEEDKLDKDTNKELNQGPCLLCILGSAFITIKICEGAPIVTRSSARGGRMFHGLGSVLTGAETFQELIELAEKGNDHKVNSHTSELIKEGDEGPENLYSKIRELDCNVFSFGVCVGKKLDDFTREDLARALLSDVAQTFVSDCLLMCQNEKAANVVLAGSFSQAPLARKVIEERFAQEESFARILNPKGVASSFMCRTMKAGSHLGALGALLQSASRSKDQGQQEPTGQSG